MALPPKKKPEAKEVAVTFDLDEGDGFEVERIHSETTGFKEPPKPAPPPQAPKPMQAESSPAEKKENEPKPPARPADFAAETDDARSDKTTGYLELEVDPNEAAAEVADGSASEVAHGPNEIDISQISSEAALPAPKAPPKPGNESGMQEEMEVTDVFEGLHSGHGFATTSEAAYEGLALSMRTLLSPIEELLHDRGGEEGAISVRTKSEADICSQFAQGLVELVKKARLIPLMVKGDSLHCEGRPVLREARKTGSGLYRLSAAGVQTMTIVEGIDASQAETLARVLTQPAKEAASEAEREGDVPRWFWEMGLTHVRLTVLETFEEIEPLPETGIPALQVPDQAVEQLIRLKSRLLASVPGVSVGRGRQTAVRNMTVSQDELRALERDLFRLGAELLGTSRRARSIVPFPGLPPQDAEVRQGLEADLTGLETREVEGLMQTVLLLQEPERLSPIVDRIVSKPEAQFAANEVDKGVTFLKGLRAWAGREPNAREKTEAVDLILARACLPRVLGPLLERHRTLAAGVGQQAMSLLHILPAPVTATVGIVVAAGKASKELAEYFKARLAEDLKELTGNLDALVPEQVAGLLDGAVTVRASATQGLARLFADHSELVARQASARALAVLPAVEARALAERLIDDEESEVRQEAVKALSTHKEAASLVQLLLKGVGSARYAEWLFAEKRAAMRAVSMAMREAAKAPLRQVVQKQNPHRRKSLSETRAAALLGLAFLKDPADDKLCGAILREAERPVLHDAARALLQTLKFSNETADDTLQRLDVHFRRFDSGEEDEAQPAASGDKEKDRDAVKELTPQVLKSMEIDDLLRQPGDRLQLLGAHLAKELSVALDLARKKLLSSDKFVVSVGRTANIAAALMEHADGPVALQTFNDHFFINGRRLRLPFSIFIKLEAFQQVFAQLRIQELLFAEKPSRADVIEVLYAITTALKVEREPWDALERTFARIRMRELSLVKESWGRQSDVSMDVKANAARLFGTLYLWLDDVAKLPDDHDLLPMRAERLVRELTDAQEEGDALLEGLLGPKVNPGDAALFIAHSVFLSAAVARWLGCRRDQIASVVRCALHMNIGLLSLPKALLEDLGAENVTEGAELGRVPLYNAARVAAAQNHGQKLNLAFVTAFESLGLLSHVGARGQKYLRPQARLMHSKLLAVAQRYVFLTTSFPRRPALASDEALARMLADPELDPRLVQAFANRSAVIPAGAKVRLSDGRECLVISAPLQLSKADPLVLKVVSDNDGSPAGDLLRGSPLITVTGEEESPVEIAGVLEIDLSRVSPEELPALWL